MLMLLKLVASGTLSELSAEHAYNLFIGTDLAKTYKHIHD